VTELRERFLAAILSGDFAQARAVAQEARESSLAFLYEEVVGWALGEVGRRWHEGMLSVADEHVATAVAQSVLASFYPTFPWVAAGPRGIVACVASERHELGARMAADLLAHDGWDVAFVGADVPLESLIELVERRQPVFVGLSVAMTERMPAARHAIAELRRRAPGTKVILGGRAAVLDGDVARGAGADAIASSASSGVEEVRRWRP
jgi:methanogenic corrinoid protein MtbC1